VNSFGPPDETQSFNFVSPSSELDDLMKDKGVENRLGPVTSAYHDGLAAYYAGDRDEALAKFDEVLGTVRTHEFAQEFRTKALRLPKAEKGGAPIAPIAGGLLALVLAGLAGVALRRRRTGSDGPEAGTSPQPPTPAPTNGAGPAGALLGTSGPLAGAIVEVSDEVILGRGDVDVRIDDPLVSWSHASVRPLDGELVVADLGSANGTLVNGRRIDGPTRLAAGDEIRVGQTILRVQANAVRRPPTVELELASA
jgi:hypothetical protein